MPAPRAARAHDLVLFGATGYTGRLVAERLAHAGEPLRWALAGRDRLKLEHERAALAAQIPECAELPLLVGDALDPRDDRRPPRHRAQDRRAHRALLRLRLDPVGPRRAARAGGDEAAQGAP